MPAHRRDDVWSSPDPVSGAGADIAPASHRAGNGRHAWNRNSGEWGRRERNADWTGPKHSSGEWPTLHLDAVRDTTSHLLAMEGLELPRKLDLAEEASQ